MPIHLYKHYSDDILEYYFDGDVGAQVETVVKFVVASQYVREGVCRFKLSQRLSVGNNYFYTWVQKGNKKLSRQIGIGYIIALKNKRES